MTNVTNAQKTYALNVAQDYLRLLDVRCQPSETQALLRVIEEDDEVDESEVSLEEFRTEV